MQDGTQFFCVKTVHFRQVLWRKIPACKVMIIKKTGVGYPSQKKTLVISKGEKITEVQNGSSWKAPVSHLLQLPAQTGSS